MPDPVVVEIRGRNLLGNAAAIIEQSIKWFDRTTIVSFEVLGGRITGALPKARMPSKIMEASLSPTFKLVFLTVVGLTVLCGGLQIALAWAWIEPSPNQQEAFAGMSFGWKMGLGAIFGLLGGKVT